MDQLVEIRALSNLTHCLRSALEGTCYEVGRTAEFVVQDGWVLAPDAWVLHSQRFEAARQADRCVDGPPDLAILLHSAFARFESTQAGIRAYLCSGAIRVWLVHPGTHTISVFHPEHPNPLTYSGHHTLYLPEPLPLGAIPLQEVFE